MKLGIVCFALLSLLALLQATEAVIPFIGIWAVGGSTIAGFLGRLMQIGLTQSFLRRTGERLDGDIGLTTWKSGTTIYDIMVCNKLAHEQIKTMDDTWISDIENKVEHWLAGFGYYKEVSVIYTGGGFYRTEKCSGPRGGIMQCCVPEVHVFISFCPKGRGWNKEQLSAWDQSARANRTCRCDNKCPAK